MQFNAEKFKVMYFGNKNIKAKYEIAGVEIGSHRRKRPRYIY